MTISATAQEVYAEIVRALPPKERLRLAALILEELTQPEASGVDSGDSWNERDRNELAAFSLQHAAMLYPENTELV